MQSLDSTSASEKIFSCQSDSVTPTSSITKRAYNSCPLSSSTALNQSDCNMPLQMGASRNGNKITYGSNEDPKTQILHGLDSLPSMNETNCSDLEALKILQTHLCKRGRISYRILAIIFASIAVIVSINVKMSSRNESKTVSAPSVEAKVWDLIWGKNDVEIRRKSSIKLRTYNFEDNKVHSKSFSFSSLGKSYSTYQRFSTDTKLVVAGKLTVGDGPCNIAELGLESGEWNLQERVQLSLYHSYSGGEVYYLLTNHTFSTIREENSGEEKGVDESELLGGKLIVVGAFDTTDRNSQVTYCSVGKWDGTGLSKVGEGLCNSAVSRGMKITAAALGGPQDVFVAGSFNTSVWNGIRHEFVNIYNIAHYNAAKQVWLPLSVGQITCSWCTVTILSLAWDSTRKQLHVAGKFNAIDEHNIPSGLAIYNQDSGHLVAHPGGGLTMYNMTENGVGTALQLDEEASVLYVMGSFQRLGKGEFCLGLAAYEIEADHWTCLADSKHTVLPSGGGNMLLTPYGLMVAGRTTTGTTWPDSSRPYTIALLTATPKKKKKKKQVDDTSSSILTEPEHDFEWSWLPGFDGHDKPLHTLANGFGNHKNEVFIAGDDLVAKWSYVEKIETVKSPISNGSARAGSNIGTITKTIRIPMTVNLSKDSVRGAVMAIAQLSTNAETSYDDSIVGYTLAVYLIAFGALVGMFTALLFNRPLNKIILSFFAVNEREKGIPLDTLTYTASVNDAYQKAMRNRCLNLTNNLQLIDPQSIVLHRIIGEGTFGRVWSAKLRSSDVAVKEFVFAQAAVAGRSAHRDSIIEEIVGEAGMMSILRHPNVLQLFGCSMTAQAIWIVSELCSLGSLRQVLDDDSYALSMDSRAKIALQVAEGMMYLHNQNPPIIHRDLKSPNILIHETFTDEISKDRKIFNFKGDNSPYRFDRTEKMNTTATIVAKIGDWGSAKATLSGSQTMTHGVGTACWLAPEVIKNARSSKYSDVYSYGIILWELETRKKVYAELESTQIIAKVANDNLRPPVPEGCLWTSMMVKCWDEDPSSRPSFEEIVRELNQIVEDFNTDSQCDTTNTSNQSSSSQLSYHNQHTEMFPIAES